MYFISLFWNKRCAQWQRMAKKKNECDKSIGYICTQMYCVCTMWVRQHIWNNAAGLNDDGLVNILYICSPHPRASQSQSVSLPVNIHTMLLRQKMRWTEWSAMNECVKNMFVLKMQAFDKWFQAIYIWQRGWIDRCTDANQILNLESGRASKLMNVTVGK